MGLVVTERLAHVARRASRSVWRRRAACRPHGLVLMYHRIAEPSADPWDLGVSPGNFAAQLDVLRQFGAVRPLSEMTEALGRASAPCRQIALTFDDGYRDNLISALPILDAAGVEATVFVSSGLTGGESRFWWDTLVRIFLETPHLPERLDITLGGQRHRWTVGTTPRPGYRRRLLRALWKALVRLEPAMIPEAIGALSDWAAVSPLAAPEDRAMTRAELLRLAGSGQIEIGGHTLTHAALTLVPPAIAAREIADGRAALRDLTGQAVESFAYPFGMHDKPTAGLVRDAGFKRSCTVAPGIATSETDPFRIPRIHVKNWPADEFEKQISSFVGR